MQFVSILTPWSLTSRAYKSKSTLQWQQRWWQQRRWSMTTCYDPNWPSSSESQGYRFPPMSQPEQSQEKHMANAYLKNGAEASVSHDVASAGVAVTGWRWNAEAIASRAAADDVGQWQTWISARLPVSSTSRWGRNIPPPEILQRSTLGRTSCIAQKIGWHRKKPLLRQTQFTHLCG